MWILRCKPSTKEQAEEHEVVERVSVGMKKDTKMAKVAKTHIRKERTLGRRTVAGKGSKGKRKVARDTLRGVEETATQICTPSSKMTVRTLKKHLTMRKSCKRDVC